MHARLHSIEQARAVLHESFGHPESEEREQHEDASSDDEEQFIAVGTMQSVALTSAAFDALASIAEQLAAQERTLNALAHKAADPAGNLMPFDSFCPHHSNTLKAKIWTSLLFYRASCAYH